MLFAALAGTAGAVGAQGARMGMGMAGRPAGGAMMVPRWVTAMVPLSWPLLLLSVGFLVWSLWRAPRLARALGYVGVALLLANQFSMHVWLFVPAMLLVLGGFAAAFALAGQRSLAPPAS